MKLPTLSKRLIIWIFLIICVFTVYIGFNYFRQAEEAKAIKTMSWVIAGRTIIIDPGHGGEDPGKVSAAGTLEKNINLAVALKLSTILNQGGASVILTRDKDQALSNGEDTVRGRKRADLSKRIEIAEKAQANLFISLHCNSFPSGRWSGAQTFYSNTVAGSKELALQVQTELNSFLGNSTRVPKPDTSSMIFKRSKIPIINVEMGFLSNPDEEKLLNDPAYQDKVAWSIYAGIVKYLVQFGDQFQPTMTGIHK